MDDNLKDIFRVFYMVKGHINVTSEAAQACYDGYFKRLWYNPEASDEGFEKLWVTYNNGLNTGS
jgi:hypothetical protein